MRGPVALAVLLCLTGCAAQAFDLQGHRGARGLVPENTLPAFAKALAIGVTSLSRVRVVVGVAGRELLATMWAPVAAAGSV